MVLDIHNTPLPNHLQAEQAVLGAILMDPLTMGQADVILKGDEFYYPNHRITFGALLELAGEGIAIDTISLAERLHSKGMLESAGGVCYLAELVNSVPTAANLAYYAGLVKDKAVHRRIILQLRQQLKHAEEREDIAELVAMIQAGTDTLTAQECIQQPFHPIKKAAIQCFEKIERNFYSTGSGEGAGLLSGFDDLDRLTNGFQKSDLIVIAARPSVGKTAFALNIAQNVSIRNKETVAIFSLEMGVQQLAQRIISAEANVDAGRLRTGTLEPADWNKMTMALSRISEAPIYIDDSPAVTAGEIRAKCRRLKKEKGLGMIIIDYLQLIAGTRKDGNRQQEVSEISRTLKQLARELDVPVLALSQLSRSVEQRQDKRPVLSDLRESGSIEQDADIVAFLHREDYYDKESEKKNRIEIIMAKQRNGPVGTVELVFMKEFNKFDNL
ncbi:replicative DNA helicase [Paenibacillus sp. FJAT-26967]|uniref:replicative DNA helicase n=1 Tax=Paenibacillus sp. FJAT-26967 TaxID=1729690 RepID=UPI0008386234|nr:replicative DNA helicase [Paenibacillus sp. FJAT-26967]